MQGWIHEALTKDIGRFAANRDPSSLLSMLPAGMLFGAIHALTPGHGKSVLASYLLGSRLAAARSLIVSTALAATHVGSAVLIAYFALPLISQTLGSVGRAPEMETLSRGLLVLIGLWLVIRALRRNSHHHEERNGVVVGFVAGLVPCPLTLFAMVLAMSRGVPEAGLTFAGAMLLGVATTLASVALTAVLLREAAVTLLKRHGSSMGNISRVLDGVAGLLLLVIAARELIPRW